MKVLVAEDDAITLRVLTALLTSWGYEVVPAATGAAAWEALSAPDGPFLALLDWEMPGVDGVEICRRVRRLAREPYPYLVLLTGRQGRSDLVDGLDAGADDYLRKPFDEAELEARLRVGQRIGTLQQELLAARDAMQHQLLHDPLTGVLNRRGGLDALGAAVAQAGRRGGTLGALMVDLDRFKQVNDTWGHAVGDAVLREAATRIASVVRPYDRVGRMGGEEFLVVLPDCGTTAAREVAERIRARVAAEPFTAGGLSMAVTCSIGVAATDVVAADALVLAADQCLYRAKWQGRNRVEVEPVLAVAV
jgi:two-component system cell cycle response regulator